MGKEGNANIPKETAQQISQMDEGKIEEAMRPYLDRAARFALLKRIRKLKDYASTKSNVFDIHTPKGMDMFKREILSDAVKMILVQKKGDYLMGHSDEMGTQARWIPVALTRALMIQYFSMSSKLELKEGSENEYKFAPELEYVPKGMNAKDYISKENFEKRDQNFWKSFEGLIRSSGKTKEEIWEEAMELKYGSKKEEMEKNEEYQKFREAFVKGQVKMFDPFKVRNTK